MRRVKPVIRSIALAGMAIIGSWGATAAASEDAFVVLSVTGGGAPFVAGDMVGGGSDVRIEDGVTMTVLDASGRLFQMTGPCRCRLPEAMAAKDGDASALTSPQTRGFTFEDNLWNAALPKLQELAEDPPADAPAQTRGSPALPARQPDLWAMAVDSSGNRCVRRGDVFLWRRKTSAAARIDLRTQSARETGLTWPAGQDKMRLPSQFVIDGESLMLQVDAEPRRLIVHVLPDTIKETEWGEILIWMAARDCRRQAQFLVDGLNDGSLFPDRGRKPGLSEL